MEDKKNAAKLEIQLDEETAQGVYANLVVVNHNETEFALDFVYVQPQGGRAKVRSRIIMAPAHIRSLIRALEKNLGSYEEKFEPDKRCAKVAKVSEEQYH
ncbi:MAG: hypothetical protein A2X84_01630 [Desulfuromonadaceae bacterium GWC2_58_13]|nr:MAG: hypothetical protein A2X84_01630 [Desulfuromonadaceae bacterium GWC2_58_13]